MMVINRVVCHYLEWDLSPDFLDYLRAFRFTGDVFAFPEGTILPAGGRPGAHDSFFVGLPGGGASCRMAPLYPKNRPAPAFFQPPPGSSGKSGSRRRAFRWSRKIQVSE